MSVTKDEVPDQFKVNKCVMSVTKDEVPDQFKVNNVQLIASFKELLKDTAGQSINRANDTSAELPMKETKELKFREPLK